MYIFLEMPCYGVGFQMLYSAIEKYSKENTNNQLDHSLKSGRDVFVRFYSYTVVHRTS